MDRRRFVLLESPWAGDNAANLQYALQALWDSLKRGEAPFASHMLYTQVLDDSIPEEREMGIEAGLAIGWYAEATVVYADLGVSEGMQRGIERANAEERPVEYRYLKGAPDDSRV